MAQGRQITILLVEDNEGFRRSLRSFLIQQGFCIIEAIDGLDALRLAADHAGLIDVVMTDYLMPKCDGLELLDRLNVAYPRLPVILLSSYAAEILSRRPDLIVFPKPCHPHILIAKLRELLRVLDLESGP